MVCCWQCCYEKNCSQNIILKKAFGRIDAISIGACSHGKLTKIMDKARKNQIEKESK